MFPCSSETVIAILASPLGCRSTVSLILLRSKSLIDKLFQEHQKPARADPGTRAPISSRTSEVAVLHRGQSQNLTSMTSEASGSSTLTHQPPTPSSSKCSIQPRKGVLASASSRIGEIETGKKALLWTPRVTRGAKSTPSSRRQLIPRDIPAQEVDPHRRSNLAVCRRRDDASGQAGARLPDVATARALLALAGGPRQGTPWTEARVSPPTESY